MARWRSVRVTRTPRQLFPFWKQVQSNWSVTAEGLRPAQLIDVGGMGNGRSCFGESRLQAVMLNESLARIGAVFFIPPPPCRECGTAVIAHRLIAAKFGLY